jgi:hypothetical protein
VADALTQAYRSSDCYLIIRGQRCKLVTPDRVSAAGRLATVITHVQVSEPWKRLPLEVLPDRVFDVATSKWEPI